MLSTRDAARLLAGDTPDPLLGIAAALGFASPLTLGGREREWLGVPREAGTLRLAAGKGTRRALLVDLREGASLRDRAPAFSRAIASGSSALHWLLLAHDRARATLVIGAPGVGTGGALRALFVDTNDVRQSDAEALATLATTAAEHDLLAHLRWSEILGRDSLTRRFYRELEGCVARLAGSARGGGSAGERRTLALLCTSRLIFLAFLETKGWLDGDRAFLRRICAGDALHGRVLDPLFFGTLNTRSGCRAARARAFGRVPFLNGGLFARTPLEGRLRSVRFADDAIGEFVGGLLARYRLTAREQQPALSDAAVDPEMLGRAFESLMLTEERHARGAFYTPQGIVTRGVDAALAAAGARDEGAGPTGEAGATSALLGLRALDQLRVLDPACGSGAFLVQVLERLADRRAALGDARSLGERRRHVLVRSIFGVDIDPIAVWLCQLRLWLSVVVEDTCEDPARVLPLPNLDRNIREGDALAEDPGREGDGPATSAGGTRGALANLRIRYARATGARKRILARLLDRTERSAAIMLLGARLESLAERRRDLLLVARGRDLFAARAGPDAQGRAELQRLRRAVRAARYEVRRLRDGGALPFAFATHFADAARAGGFDLVLGNPPWVRPHGLSAARREELRSRFVTVREGAWTPGARFAGAGRGFASQADLAAPFIERALALATPGGLVGLLVPSKLWRSLAGGGVRALLARDASLLALDDWSATTTPFEASVFPSFVLARRGSAATTTTVTQHASHTSRSWRVASRAIPFDESVGAPWILVPTVVRAAFDELAASGVPLARSPLGRPLLGVKCGCNRAFLIRDTPDGVERALLRPLLRGEHVRAWGVDPARERESILWTHDRRGAPLRTLPPGARSWLARWRPELEKRSDARGGAWWSLFRTEGARADAPRVVWADIGRAPRALVLDAGDPTVPLNTCYVVRTPEPDDAHALAALLNSSLIAAWLSLIAEPARGGYLRFLGWTCAQLPLPRDWGRARALLAPIGIGARAGRVPEPATLDAAVCAAFGFEADALAPLTEWATR